MNESRLERLAPLSGIAAVILIVVSALTLARWDYLPSGSDLVSFYADKSTQVMTAGYIGAVAAFALIWFAGSVRRALAAVEGGDGRLASLAFGGTIVAGGLLAAGYSAVVAAGARGGSSGGITGSAAVAMNDLYGTIIATGGAAAMAVLLVAFAVVTLRHGGFPRWLAWVSLILGIGSLTPVSYIFLSIDMLWIAVVSVWLYMQASS